MIRIDATAAWREPLVVSAYRHFPPSPSDIARRAEGAAFSCFSLHYLPIGIAVASLDPFVIGAQRVVDLKDIS